MGFCTHSAIVFVQPRVSGPLALLRALYCTPRGQGFQRQGRELQPLSGGSYRSFPSAPVAFRLFSTPPHFSSTSMILLSGLAALGLLSCSFSCQHCLSEKLRVPASVKTAFRSWNWQLNKVAAVTLQITDFSSHQRPDPGRWMGSLGKISRWSEAAGARLVLPSGFRSVGAALGWSEARADCSFFISQEEIGRVGSYRGARRPRCQSLGMLSRQPNPIRQEPVSDTLYSEARTQDSQMDIKLFRSPASEIGNGNIRPSGTPKKQLDLSPSYDAHGIFGC